MIAFGSVVFPFNYLQPSALAGFDKKSWSLILQLSIYAIAVLTIRSRFRFIFQTSKNLFKVPFILVLLVFTVLSAGWSETPLLTLIAGIVLCGTAIFATYVSTYYNWTGLTQLLRWGLTCIGLAGIPVSLLLASNRTKQRGMDWVTGASKSLRGNNGIECCFMVTQRSGSPPVSSPLLNIFLYIVH